MDHFIDHRLAQQARSNNLHSLNPAERNSTPPPPIIPRARSQEANEDVTKETPAVVANGITMLPIYLLQQAIRNRSVNEVQSAAPNPQLGLQFLAQWMRLQQQIRTAAAAALASAASSEATDSKSAPDSKTDVLVVGSGKRKLKRPRTSSAGASE